jgi:cation-transporting ATPase 13A2
MPYLWQLIADAPSREWRDPTWTSHVMIREGLVEAISQQRHTLFGNNELNIESKSTFSLLVEEVCIWCLL